MISKYNYEKLKDQLECMAKDRGHYSNYSRQDWDTLPGWNKRGKSILKGSCGYKVKMTIPITVSIKNKKVLHSFCQQKKTLFLINQVYKKNGGKYER